MRIIKYLTSFTVTICFWVIAGLFTSVFMGNDFTLNQLLTSGLILIVGVVIFDIVDRAWIDKE